MDIQELLSLYAAHPQVSAVASVLQGDKVRNLFTKGLSGSGAAMLIASLFTKGGGRFVCVLNDLEEAGYFYHDLVQLTASPSVYFFPSAYRRDIKYGHIDAANEILRTEALSILQNPKEEFVIVTYPDALAEKVVTRDVLKENTLQIHTGEKLDNMFVADVLNSYGFERVDYVYEPGQYAMRGSILDVFSFSCEYPYRIDFFGDEVETIRTFDVLSAPSMSRPSSRKRRWIISMSSRKSTRRAVPAVRSLILSPMIPCWLRTTWLGARSASGASSWKNRLWVMKSPLPVSRQCRRSWCIGTTSCIVP